VKLRDEPTIRKDLPNVNREMPANEWSAWVRSMTADFGISVYKVYNVK
jgi:hypothetical protein